MIDSTVRFNYILTEFLAAATAYEWSSVEVSSYNNRFICFPLQFYQLLPHVCGPSIVRQVDIKDLYIFLKKWPLYHYIMPFFTIIPVIIPVNFLALKSSFSEINIATAAFFWLLLTVVYHFHCLSLNYLSFHLKCSLIDNVQLGLVFIFTVTVSVFSLAHSDQSHLKWLLT